MRWKQGGTKVPKFYQELSLMSSTIMQNFKKFGSQVFPKKLSKFQKNQNFIDKIILTKFFWTPSLGHSLLPKTTTFYLTIDMGTIGAHTKF